MLQELVSQTNCTERQTHCVTNMTFARYGQLTTAAAEVNHKNGRGSDTYTRNQAEMNESCLFQPRNNFHLPSRCRAYPLQKGSSVTSIAQGTGADHAHRIRAFLLHRAVKAPEHLDCVGHGFWGKQPCAEHAFAQACHLPIFVNLVQPSSGEARDFQTDRV